jgi:hypothetical protein
MKMPKKKSSTFTTLEKSKLDTKFKLREGVLLKQKKGAEEVNVDEHATKNSHISHPAKLNVTGNLDENKVSFRIMNVLSLHGKNMIYTL